MITIKDLKKEIKKQHRRIKANKQDGYNFLGFVENKDLTEEVINLFSITDKTGSTWYNWVGGTEKMNIFIEGMGLTA